MIECRHLQMRVAGGRVGGFFGQPGFRLRAAQAKVDIAVAITAGNYTDEKQGMPPARVIREVVLASVL